MQTRVLLLLLLAFLLGKASAQEPRLILPIGHNHPVVSASVSPDGSRLATVSSEGLVKLWDLPTRRLLIDLPGKKAYRYVAFSHDSKRIALLCEGSIQFWDASSAVMLAELPTTDAKTIDFSRDDTRLLINTGTSVTMRDVATGKQVQFEGHKEEVNGAFFSPDGLKVLTASGGKYSGRTIIDNSARVFDAASGKLLLTLTGHSAAVNSATMSVDGKRIITASDDRTMILWDAISGKKIREIVGHDDPVNKACFSEDGKWILSASGFKDRNLRVNDFSVRLWDAASGKSLAIWKGHTNAINDAFFSPDQKKVISISDDHSIRLWDVAGKQPPDALRGHANLSHSAVFSSDGSLFLTIAEDLSVRVWETGSGALVTNLRGHRARINTAIFSPDGTMIVTASEDHWLRFWNARTGALLKSRVDINEVDAAQFSPDGKRLLVTIGLATYLWDVASLSVVKVMDAHIDMVAHCSFSADGKLIVTASWDNTSKIWDGMSGAYLRDLPGHQDRVMSAVFSPDASRILTTSLDGTARIWDVQTGRLLHTVSFEGNYSSQGFFSADGKRIFILSGSTAVGVWDANTGKHLADISGHSEYISSAALSPDGKRLLTASGDATTMLWDAATGKNLCTFSGHTNPVTLARFSPDQKRIVTLSEDRTIKLWDVVTGKLCYTILATDTSDYLTITPEGYYRASPAATQYLYYVTPQLKVISFEQLDVKYNRPDKVLEAAGHRDTALRNSYRNAYRKRIQKLGIDTSAFTARGFGLPQTDIVNRGAVPFENGAGAVELTLHATDKSFVLDRFNIWINESPLFGSRGISLRHRRVRAFDTTIRVALSTGDNTIETSVTNANGTESFRMPLQVRYLIAAPPRPHLYFIGIGINEFKDAGNNLRYSVKDVRDMAFALKRQYKNQIRIDTLFDRQVSARNVAALKQVLKQTSPDDKVILVYSGHGLLSKDYDYYLSTFDVNFSKPEEGGLPYEVLESLLDSIPARQKLMLIDACHSGEVDKEDLANFVAVETKDSLKKGIELKPDPSKRRMGTKSSFELMQQLFVNVGRSTGATIISAAAGTQFALERGDLQNGVFTYAILEFMRTHATATVSQLKTYVNQRVPALTKGLQVPTSRSENKTVDWKVW